jgi:hypothetical protein
MALTTHPGLAPLCACVGTLRSELYLSLSLYFYLKGILSRYLTFFALLQQLIVSGKGKILAV